MEGGEGNDQYWVDSTSDRVTESSSTAGGTDIVYASVTWTLDSTNYIENLTLTSTGAINGYGNGLNNTIEGNNRANILDGGTGADTLLGYSGNDTYVVNSTDDKVTESSSGGGTDLVKSSVTWELGSYLENLELTGSTAITGKGNSLNNSITGNSANNSLYGYGGDDILNGGLGADTMEGGDGNDTYYVNIAQYSSTDKITESSTSAGGTDLVYAEVSWTLGSYIENLELIGTYGISGYGNELNNILKGNNWNNTLRGYGGDDKLYGNGGSDELSGGDNNDLLDGGSGDDSLIGGSGTDIFYFNGGKDTITDFAAGEKIYVQLAGIDLASEVKVSGDVYTFTGYDSTVTSLTVTGVDPTSIYYDSTAAALVMAA